MLSEEYKNRIEKWYEEGQASLGLMKEDVNEWINSLDGDKKYLMELLAATLPLSDIGSVPFNTLEDYADHFIRLWDGTDVMSGLPEDILLHDVFYPRVGTEKLTRCREFFHNELKAFKNLPEPEKILRINEWCASHMTYRSSDDRTQSPLTSYYSGYGRCGEETVFAVTAFRSVGVPARQVYAPLWAHCDDNHAWVEVYTGGRWHYCGACEPEPDLDTGWFDLAASRAPLIHCRTYFPYLGNSEELIARNGACYLYNRTAEYAHTGRLNIRAMSVTGAPVQGIDVTVSLVNYGSLKELVRLETDGNGRCSLEAGICTYFISCNNYMCTAAPDTGEIILLADSSWADTVLMEWVQYAPKPCMAKMKKLDDRQGKLKKQIVERADEERRRHISAMGYSGEVDNGGLNRLLTEAAGNHGQIQAFIDTVPDIIQEEALEFLNVLSKKDLRDVENAVLIAHFGSGGHSADELEYVRNPRIGYEELGDWRKAVSERFTESELSEYAASPSALADMVRITYLDRSNRYHEQIDMMPEAALRLGRTNERGCEILAVALMRAAGIPARLDPVTGFASWRESGDIWRTGKETGFLYLKSSEVFRYGAGITLSSGNKCLGYPQRQPFIGGEVPVGMLRLCISRRLPSGDQIVKQSVFDAVPGRSMTLCPEVIRVENVQLLTDIELYDGLEDAKTDKRNTLIMLLEPGKEPSEHALDELENMLADIPDDLGICLILEEQNNCTVRSVFSDIMTLRKDGEMMHTAARSVFAEPEVYPLLLLVDGKRKVRACCSGYTVGSLEQMLDLSALV